MEKTAALLIGFGGPQGMEEVRPFLDSVLEGVKIPPQRFEEVMHHYEAVGGVSQFIPVTYRQKRALESWLSSQNAPLSVCVGFRHSRPGFREAFEDLKKSGVKKTVGFVLASFRSFSSLEKYQLKVAEARREAGAEDIELVYTDSFADHPLYLEAQAAQAREAMKGLSEEEKRRTFFLFSAHSIPAALCERSCMEDPGRRCYGSQFHEASSRIAGMLGLGKSWSTAYQSRSGNPRDPWLEPDIQEVIRGLDKERFTRVFVVPVGFLCDNVEVVYDLDIEARQACEARGLRYSRASTVVDHPLFIKMMGRQILEKL